MIMDAFNETVEGFMGASPQNTCGDFDNWEHESRVLQEQEWDNCEPVATKSFHLN